MTKKTSKTNVTARAAARADASLCASCGNKIEVVLRVPQKGKKYMARLCCEKAGVA